MLRRRRVSAPVDNAGLLSFAAFTWLSPVMYKKEPLELEDLPTLSKYDSSDVNSER